MFSYKATALENYSGTHYHIYQNRQLLSFRQVINMWSSDSIFCAFYTKLLQECAYPAFFWEHPPITADRIDGDYEFVLIKSSTLDGLEARPHPFQSYFDQSDTSVIDFWNIHKDALLIVPCPQKKSTDYAHLASFLRTASSIQVKSMWQKLGSCLTTSINQNVLWISTHGLGVIWLHVRLDTYPKYYHYSPYRNTILNPS